MNSDDLLKEIEENDLI